MTKKKDLTTQDVEPQEVSVLETPADSLSSFKEDVEFTEYSEEEKQDEEKELTDEEKQDVLIEQLKRARQRFTPIKNTGKITTNQFGSAYKENRRRKNKVQRKSRSINRK